MGTVVNNGLDASRVASHEEGGRETQRGFPLSVLRRVPVPYCASTDSGGILLEWEGKDCASLDFDFESRSAYFHAIGENGADVEAEFSLAERDWPQEVLAYLLGYFGAEGKV